MTLRPPDTLSTIRLILRPLRLTDAAAVYAYASDEETTRFLIFPRHRSIVDSEGFARRCAECWQSGSAFPWAVTVRETGMLIGVIELRLSPPRAEFGYVLRRAEWGQGYGGEMATAVVAWALAQPEIHRVWTTVHPDNQRSQRVLEKAGLRFETRLALWEARPNLGEAAGDALVYALIKA